jgi:hypothetical protein
MALDGLKDFFKEAKQGLKHCNGAKEKGQFLKTYFKGSLENLREQNSQQGPVSYPSDKPRFVQPKP